MRQVLPTDGERPPWGSVSRPQYGVVREELPFLVPGIYGSPIGAVMLHNTSAVTVLDYVSL